jgi:hypothetical protein
MIGGMRRWLVLLIVIASCKKGRDRGDDEVTRAMALGAIYDIKQAIASAKTRLGTPDAAQGMARCASVASTRLELRDIRDIQFHELATELDRLCDVELPTAELTAALALIDQDPAACQKLAIDQQLQLLEKAPLPETTTAIARFREKCPAPLPNE